MVVGWLPTGTAVRCCERVQRLSESSIDPHFHAQYGEHVAQIDLTSLEVLNGSLPARALRLVREWAELHRGELAMNWDLAQALEPLVEIDPLP